MEGRVSSKFLTALSITEKFFSALADKGYSRRADKSNVNRSSVVEQEESWSCPWREKLMFVTPTRGLGVVARCSVAL